jgi:predicted permease
MLWVGGGLAILAAVLLAYVPRLPSPHAPAGLGLSSGGIRITPGTNRRLRVFATMQIACSFVLLAGAGMLLATLVSRITANTGVDLRRVLAVDIPTSATGVGMGDAKVINFYQETTRRLAELPGVEAVAIGAFVPWRDAGSFGAGVPVTAEGYKLADGEDYPRAHLRITAPGFFGLLGLPMVAGRDFNDEDKAGRELVAVVSYSVAQRLFPNGDAVNRRLSWKSPISDGPIPTRIIGVVADFDDQNIVQRPALNLYLPLRQLGVGGRLFVRTSADPYTLVPAVTRVIRELSPEQPVERAATLQDVRNAVLSPERLNAFVFSGFAGIALLIAVVGVAGVLAFSVSARTREFGIRLAVGSAPRQLLVRVLSEGVWIAAIGTVAGVIGGFVLARVAGKLFALELPGALPVVGAAAVLIAAAVIASLMPAARAARVDVLQALRSD